MIMNRFSWFDATSIKEAFEQVTATVSEHIQPKGPKDAAVFKTGGVDLLDLVKEGLANPSRIVNIRNIPGLDEKSFDKKSGLRLGANVTLAEMAEDPVIRENYLALHLAVNHAATPQLRNMSTLGGNLAQRTRCWYFRSLDHECFRKGTGTCFAQDGENEFHAIMRNEDCASVHASSVATALMAFNATVEITNSKGEQKTVTMEEFFIHPSDDSRYECILKSDELITAVIVPPVSSGTKSAYIKQGARESYDWAIADVAVVAEMSGSTCKKVEIVLGAAAPIPFKSMEAIGQLKGKTINDTTAGNAARAAMEKATPLTKNGYKVDVFNAIIKRAILQLV